VGEIKIYFDIGQNFELINFNPLNGLTGLYFIFLSKTFIEYPFKKSKLIYIGMSEKKTNSIGARLTEHFVGQSGNKGIFNYKVKEQLKFTYINFKMFQQIWSNEVEDLETYFILDFVKNFGVYPICNNKTSFEVYNNKEISCSLKIDWDYFK